MFRYILLRQSEERFRGTFENATVGIAHAEAEGRCLRANQ
jgi:PAS domain-containing protein